MNERARALRQRLTEAEKPTGSKLRDRRFGGIACKRQEPIAHDIVGFVDLDLRLIVEIEGGPRAEGAAYAIRPSRLEESGYHVARFWNHDVLRNLDGVLEALAQGVNISRSSIFSVQGPSPPSSPHRGEGADRA